MKRLETRSAPKEEKRGGRGEISFPHRLRRGAAWGLALLAASLLSGIGSSATAKDRGADPEASEADVQASPKYQANGDPILKGKCAVLVDTRTGQVLWEKNSRLRRPMASLTKVMTSLLILESGKLDDTVIASKKANQTGDSSMYLAVGEKVKLRDLLWAILLHSANDGCVAAAEHLGGTVPKFVAQMNRKAKELGLTDTHFVTPNGLNAPDHYSTAYDLAKLTLAAMKYPLFNEIVKTKKHLIGRSIRKGNAMVVNRARILWRWSLADGVKTGYTHQAGHCFIGSATYGGWRLLSVVLNSPKVGDDTRTLLGYGFRRFESIKLADGGKPLATLPVTFGQKKSVPVGFRSDLYAVIGKGSARPNGPVFVDRPASVRAPIATGAPLAKVNWEKPDKGKVVEADLVALQPVSGRLTVAASAPFLWWPLGIVLITFGALRYGASAKDHRQRGRRIAPRGRNLGRRG